MKIAIIYSSMSASKNTESVAQYIHKELEDSELHLVEHFSLEALPMYDAIIIGTYTWGNGEIPQEMQPVYDAFLKQDLSHIVTGVFGTGDTFYPRFCGAVDVFKDLLAEKTNLAVTLKVELYPQSKDIQKTKLFAEKIKQRLKGVKHAYSHIDRSKKGF